MKQIVLLLIVAGMAQGLKAQELAAQEGGAIAALSRELARTEFYSASSGARIDVIVTDDAKQAVQMADVATGRSAVTAYGVRLLSDSSQDGRANANAAMDRFGSMYPGVEVYMSYEIPAFWVTAGHFVDRLDAVALCGKVQAQFPRAFVVSMDVAVAQVIARERAVPAAPVPAAPAAPAEEPASEL